MFPVYGGKCLSRKAVHNWVEKFSQRRSNVAYYARPGNCAVGGRVDWSWQEDDDSVATALGCSHGLAYSIMHDSSKYRKVCARWVPRKLKVREEMNRTGLSLHLIWYADEGEDKLDSIVTGHESWVHYYKPESKRVSVETSLFTLNQKV
jgi:hypothetical protein